jgi:hypothetical protein
MLAHVILYNMIVRDKRKGATIHIGMNDNPEASFALSSAGNTGGTFSPCTHRVNATLQCLPCPFNQPFISFNHY